MPTMIYAPGVRVYIQAGDQGDILDVSEDVTEGTLVRRLDGVSTFNFTLNNARRKYDSKFTPNDRIIVLMRRLRWLQVFTGYLNTVPLLTAWPREVPLSASCSLKRLQYWWWDPNLAATQNMVMQAMASVVEPLPDAGDADIPDPRPNRSRNAPAAYPIPPPPDGGGGTGPDIGGIGGGKPRKPDDTQIDAGQDVTQGVLAILENVVGWPASHVHIGQIPEDWFDIAARIAEQVALYSEEGEAARKEIFGQLGGAGTYGAPGSGSALGLLSAGNYGGTRLNGQQVRNAEIIFTVGSRMGMSNKDITTAIVVAWVESRLINVHHGDADSLGLFQQRASWGSVQERTNPERAAEMFYGALKQQSGRSSRTIQELAYAVQRSAASLAYKYGEASTINMAQAVVSQINERMSQVGGSFGSTGGSSNTNYASVALSYVKDYPNIPYRQGDRSASFLAKEPPAYLDCSSFVMKIYMLVNGKLGNIPPTSATQSAWCKKISAKQALDTPGALVFVGGSSVHHVEVSLGDGRRTVGSHRSGVPASVANNSPSYWSHGGLMPGISYSGIGQAGGTFGITGSTGLTVGGSNVFPVKKHNVTTAYHKPGDWAAGHHTGVDFGEAATGDQVFSVTAGKVIEASSGGEWGSSYGNHVVVQSGDVRFGYCHLSSIAVSVGDQVQPGDVLGQVGNTGRSFGDHLHWEARKAPFGYGDDIDPMPYIKNAVDAGGATSGMTPTNKSAVSIWQKQVEAKDLANYNPADPVDALFGDSPWRPAILENSYEASQAQALQGAYALLNDQPLLPYVANMFASTMRSYCSAPNGDLIAWFPDYYGLWGTAGILRLEPIEIIDLAVNWSDDQFVTHQYVDQGNYVSFDLSTGTAATQFGGTIYSTTGLANIDIPEVMEALFGIPADDHASFAAWVYNRFGARPSLQSVQGLSGPKSALFSALYLFMRQWAYQYSADVPLTFMPEAWPGMLLQVPKFDLQAYITTVTHSFAFGSSAGFTTTLNLSSPAYMPKGDKPNSSHVLFGLPVAGGYTSTNSEKEDKKRKEKHKPVKPRS